MSARMPRQALGLGFLAAALAATMIGWLPWPLAVGYVVLSGIAYGMYALDKRAARMGAQRTPENTLHLVDLLGGWPGALVAQQRARHKTAKTSFQIFFWATVLVNLVLVAWLVRSGLAQAWTASLTTALG